LDLKKDYISVNYSTTDIDLHLQKILSYPIYLTIMSLFAMMIMFNIKTSSNKIFYLTLSILLSVSIYYINHFFGLVGKTEKVPILVSVWFPILILFIASAIGFVNLNEK
jgi:lipopolysaccharide export system permease protein